MSLFGRQYLRVSFDRSGRQRSNEEQDAENGPAAAMFDVKLGGTPYRDTGSASRHARKRRDDFDALLDDLRHDRFGADVLWMWECSRGSRTVSEWVELIELCEARRVRIGVTVDERFYDPTIAADRKTLQTNAVDAEYESAKVSMRTKRSSAANAAAGKPHGQAPYGYRRVYDPKTGRLLGQEPDPVEAPIVVTAFERIAAGHSLRAVASDMAAAGVVGRRGRPMTPATLRPMLLSPAYKGRRVHTPGSSSRSDRDRVGTSSETDATWAPLISVELFEAVRRRLSAPERRTSRPGRGVHLLSMIARCDVCEAPLAATYRHADRKQYQCHVKGCVRVDAVPLEEWAEHQVLEVLTRPDVVERLTAEPGGDDEVAAARDDVARIRAEHADLLASAERGAMSPALSLAHERGITARLRDAEAHVRDLTAPSPLAGLIEPGEQAIAQWEDDEATPMSTKREIVRILFSAGLLGVLSVARADTPGSVLTRIRLDGRPLPVVTTVL